MPSRVRGAPHIDYRVEYVRDGVQPVRKPAPNKRTRLWMMIAASVSVMLLIYATWPSTVEDPAGDRVFRGEVWGDLTTEGYIWGERVSEYDRVSIGYSSSTLGERLHVSVSNVSSITLVDRSEDTEETVPCAYGTFDIATDGGRLEAYLVDLWLYCEFREFSGQYPGDEEDYWPTRSIASVEGHGHLVNGMTVGLDQFEGFMLDTCTVTVGHHKYYGMDDLFIPDEERAYVEIEGHVGPRGGISTGLRPHVNGSLEVEDFLHEKGGRSQWYDRITFEGEDIYIQHSGGSQSGTGGTWAWFDQWTINVSVSPDTTVEIEEAWYVPVWMEMLLIMGLALLVVFTFKTWRDLGRPPREDPHMGPPEGSLYLRR